MTQTAKKPSGSLPQQAQNTDLAFTSRALINCSLPLKPLKNTLLTKQGKKIVFASKFVRNSGPYRVKVLADEEFGVPFGKDRLFIFWLITEAVKTKSRTIYYESVRSVLKDMRLDYGKKNRDWLKGAINRIMNSTLFLEYDNGHIHGIEKDTILSKVVGVLDPKKREYEVCYFELSQDFFRELVTERHGLPFDIDAIFLFKNNYGAMDLFIWWQFKLFSKAQTEPFIQLSLSSLKLQFGQTDVTDKEFKRQMTVWCGLVNKIVLSCYGVDPKILVMKNTVYFKCVEIAFKRLESAERPNTLPAIREVSHGPANANGMVPLGGVFGELLTRARERSKQLSD